MKELVSEVAGGGKDSQQTQPKPKIQLLEQGDLFCQSNNLGSSVQEIDKRFLLGCESTNVSVERSDEDKDADENVDADQISTGKPVKSEQSIGSFTQREKTDIDFRVPGLPHAVVKEAEKFSVQELVKKIESHPHREALQADLQQNNVYNPFSNNSKAMIRELGNVAFFESEDAQPPEGQVVQQFKVPNQTNQF